MIGGGTWREPMPGLRRREFVSLFSADEVIE
jgi:hypothetical protein